MFAQEETPSRFSLGLNVGYGDQSHLAIHYKHFTHHLQTELHYEFYQGEDFGISLLGMPHAILTDVGENDHSPQLTRGYEWGINGGFMFRWKFMQDVLNLYLLISTGPHYVSHTPERQSTGYIFSDNFFAGIQFQLTNGWYIDFRPGFRHISNANLQKPNGGVNSVIYNLGIVHQL